MRSAFAFPAAPEKSSAPPLESGARISAITIWGHPVMPPVNSASSADVDNEATAELPVLDVAAYEATLTQATLEESQGLDENAHTDSWAAPGEALTPATQNMVEATTEMPAVRLEATLTMPAYDFDHSGTHEMPAMPPIKRQPVTAAEPAKNQPAGNRAARKKAAADATPAA